MNKNALDSSDRISELPDFIVHHILSFLDSYADLLKTSILSKRWFTLWATFPNLDFRLFNLLKTLDGIERKKTGLPIDFHRLRLDPSSTEKLVKYATYTLSRFYEHDVSAHTFKLYIDIGVEEPEVATHIVKWISLVIKKDVKVLNISVGSPVGSRARYKYHLPEIILSATSLTSLKLVGCELPSALLVDGVKFKCLKSLRLKMLQIDEKVIKHLTAMCPLVEELKVSCCNGYEVFSVSGLPNLQKLWVIPASEVEMIDIEAPDLTYLSISSVRGTPPRINVSSCKNLRTLCLGAVELKTSWFCDFVSSFPLLENVHLGDCTLEKYFKLSSHSLRKFELDYCFNLEEIRIDAPNLLLFRYEGKPDQELFLLTSESAKWEAYISFDLEEDEDIRWFIELRQFLYKANHFRVLKLYVYCSTDCVSVEDLKATCTPPYELEQLELTIEPLRSYFPAVIDAVFWCCRPQSINLGDTHSYYSEAGKKFLKSVYEKLLHQNDESLKEVEIVVAGGREPETYFSNINSLLDELLGLPKREIIFLVK